MNSYLKPGQACKVWGIILIVCGTIVYAAAGGPEERPVGLAGGLAMISGVLLHFRGRRLAAKALAIGPNSPLFDDKPDVLYLRSFLTDPSSVTKRLQSGFTTEEEQLAVVLKPFGDLIAIGQPGESLPMPGATRLYTSDKEWQNLVLDKMRSSALVVIRAGAGPGLFWEFAQAFRHIPPERLLILVFRTTPSEYVEMANMAKTDFGIALPEVPRPGLLSAAIDIRDNPSKLRSGFIRFSSGWRAEFLPLPQTFVRLGYNDLLVSFNRALRPVFEAHGITWRQLKRFGTG